MTYLSYWMHKNYYRTYQVLPKEYLERHLKTYLGYGVFKDYSKCYI
jgi:hypothetical protein